MPCYHPLKGYRSKIVNPSGKRSIVFNKNEGYADRPVELPCGQCMGCRLQRSKQWAIRMLHEAKMHDQNCFVTLTYDEDHLPKDGTLVVSDFQNFLKRLREQKRYEETKNKQPHSPIRFFHCGEYGETYARPHYHACLFNYDFPDKVAYKKVNGNQYYTSQTLERLWGKGITMIGAVTYESAAYVARYITKKVTGERAQWFYSEIDETTGEIIREIKPEYVTMSRRPGIGKTWFEKYKNDVIPHDHVIINGKKQKTPKFYLKQIELENQKAFIKIKYERMVGKQKHKDEMTTERLLVKEDIQYLKSKKLIRVYENEA